MQAYDRDSITIYEAACRKQGNGEQMKTLIIYKSKHGTGKEVAAYLQQKLCADLQEADPALSWEGYERIVCVGSNMPAGWQNSCLPAFVQIRRSWRGKASVCCCAV